MGNSHCGLFSTSLDVRIGTARIVAPSLNARRSPATPEAEAQRPTLDSSLGKQGTGVPTKGLCCHLVAVLGTALVLCLGQAGLRDKWLARQGQPFFGCGV